MNKRFAVIGGGAAGTAAALSLLELDPTCTIDIFEQDNRLGGVAHSNTVRGMEINYGVQGVHSSFVHTISMIERARAHDLSIPKLFPTNLTSKFTAMGRVTSLDQSTKMFTDDVLHLRRFCIDARKYPDFYAIMTVVDAVPAFGVSSAFIHTILLPLLALFFGTGNQTSQLPAAMAALVFDVDGRPSDNNVNQSEDQKMENFGRSAVTLFGLDRATGISLKPGTMLALPPLARVYSALQHILEQSGRVRLRLGTGVTAISEDSDTVQVYFGTGNQATFDRVVLAAQANHAAKLLNPSSAKARLLRRIRYYRDVTVTHQDTQHMEATFGYDGKHNYYVNAI